MDLDFSGLTTDYPYTLLIPQNVTEKLLSDRLLELGGTVLRPKKLTSVAEDADGVTATFDDGASIRARYVVGADGIHSTVREQAGIGFHGGAYEESFILADVNLRGEAPVRFTSAPSIGLTANQATAAASVIFTNPFTTLSG